MSTQNKRIKEYISWIPAIFMIIIIFALSSQEGDVSTAGSKEVTILVTKSDAWSEYLEGLHVIVREMAHFSEYALLALFIGFAVKVNGFRGKLRLIYMILLSEMIACLDEFYQVFVPERYGDLIDLVIDSFGIFISVFLVIIAEKLFKKSVSKDNKQIKEQPGSRRKFMGIEIDNITFEEAVDKIIDYAHSGKKKYIVTPNVDHIVKIQKDEEFKKIYDDADLVVVDGTPVMWIAESRGNPFKEKIPGADMLPRVCEKAAKEGVSIFLFGAKSGVADKAAEKLCQKYKGLKIAGVYSPEVGFEKDEAAVKEAIKIINDVSPDILVMALGSPKQEKFIYKYRDEMDFGIALPFGAALDFAADNVKRAPLWMRKAGLEWLFRFLQEPGRLFHRYFVDDMKIFYYAWKYRHDI